MGRPSFPSPRPARKEPVVLRSVEPVINLDHGAYRQDGDDPGQDVDEHYHRQNDGADEYCEFKGWVHQVVRLK